MYNLSQMGVEWTARAELTVTSNSPPLVHGDQYSTLSFEVKRGTLRYKGGKWEAQVICGPDQRRLATTNILDFYSTITQSFICGFGAISMYDEYPSNYEIVYHSQNDSNSSKSFFHTL